MRPPLLLRADLPAQGIIVFVADVTQVALDAEWRHLAGRISATALARLFAATALAGGFVEGTERLTLQIRSAGKLGGIYAEVDAEGNLRGYTHQKVVTAMDRSPTSWEYGIGVEGWIVAIRATDDRIEYQGTVPLVQGDVTTDVLQLLQKSEQREVRLRIYADYDEQVRVANGVLVQGLHDMQARAYRDICDRLDAEETGGLLEQGAEPDAILRVVIGDAYQSAMEIKFRRPLRFRCRCNRDKVRAMLLALEPVELREMLAKDHGSMINCQFCNDQYSFDEHDLRKILAERERGA